MKEQDGLRAFCVMVSDPENQPHQWVGDIDGTLRCLHGRIRAVLKDTVASCDPDTGGGECVMFEALLGPTKEEEDGEADVLLRRRGGVV